MRTVDDTRQRFGFARRRIAESIDISARTLRDWRRKLRQGRGGAIRGRGRPTFTCDVETRNGVIRFLHHVTGPVRGLPALRAHFGQVPRCVLANLLTRYRRVWRRRYCPWGKRLVWHVPGSVWAMDFSKASYRIDGVDWHIFAVRDLGSSHQLAWQAVASERAEEVIPILPQLFQEHGAPLVLKSDNGSAFVAEAMEAAMREDQVVPLFSAAGRLSYNGGLERSNGVNLASKTGDGEAIHHALRVTRPRHHRARLEVAPRVPTSSRPKHLPPAARERRAPMSDLVLATPCAPA